MKNQPAYQPTTDAEKAFMAEVEEAKTARSKFQSVYNLFYDLAAPWRARVGEEATSRDPRAPAEQDNIFDTTLQDAVDDWASDCIDEFTPSYKPWTKHVILGDVEGFSKEIQRKIKDMAEDRKKKVYDRIRESAFEEQSQEFYVDLAIGYSGMYVPYTPSGQPLRFEHSPLAETLVIPSPFGGPGNRFRQRHIAVKHLDIIWPDADWSHLGTPETRQRNDQFVEITIGWRRDWTNRSEEVWVRNLFCGSKQVARDERQVGPCEFIVTRARVSQPSAIGIGPANKALAPARTLDQLAYMELKRTGKIVDPPVVYSDDGTLNPEGGIDAGFWYEAGEGFNIQELSPMNDGREAWFNQEDLRGQVKRALFQDKPYQRGDTPPTAAQWLSEESTNARRKGFPRARISREFVVPTLRRVDFILTKRGELEDIEVEGTLVRVEPISPMSRASDLDEVQMAQTHLGMFTPFGEAILDNYDLPATMEKAREKLGTSVIVIASPEDVAKKQQDRAQQEALARGAAIEGEPNG